MARHGMKVVGYLDCPGYTVVCFFCRGKVGEYYTVKDEEIGMIISCVVCTKEWFGESIVVKEEIMPKYELRGYLYA